MKAIIPTGGRGTRMQPLTFSTNKHFIPVANKPLIFYPIESIAETGIKEVLITYNPGWLDAVKTILGDGSKWSLKFTYVLQKKPLGLADIVRSCEKDLAGEDFVFHLGDNIFADGIVDLYNYFMTEKPNGLVAMVEHPENNRMGVPYFDKDGNVTEIIEKPENPPHKFAMPGIYFSDSTFFKAFKGNDAIKASARGEWEIPDPFTWMIKHNYRVLVREYKGTWLDPGKFNDWLSANKYLLDKKLVHGVGSKLDKSVDMSGTVEIGKDTVITNSKIIGPVAIGNKVNIKNSVIGPHTSVSSGSTIENSHLENSVLMSDVVIKNIKKPITESLIGTSAEIIDEGQKPDQFKFFIGEKSKIIL